MNIFEQIKEVITEVNGCEEIELTYDLKLDVGLDSLSLVSVIVGLEHAFGITFDDADLDPSKINLVQDLVGLVNKML